MLRIHKARPRAISAGFSLCVPDSLSKGLFYGRATMTKDTQPRRRVDWDAVERDYRATQMTLRELGDKHGCDHAAIARKAKKDGWQRDLTSAVRIATNARVIEEVVTKAVNNSQQDVTSTIAAAAEVNTRIIMKHRRKLSDLHELVEVAKAKLEEIGDVLTDVREVATFVQAVGNLTTSTKALIEQERKSFGLDETSEKKTDLIEDLILEAMNDRKADS